MNALSGYAVIAIMMIITVTGCSKASDNISFTVNRVPQLRVRTFLDNGHRKITITLYNGINDAITVDRKLILLVHLELKNDHGRLIWASPPGSTLKLHLSDDEKKHRLQSVPAGQSLSRTVDIDEGFDEFNANDSGHGGNERGGIDASVSGEATVKVLNYETVTGVTVRYGPESEKELNAVARYLGESREELNISSQSLVCNTTVQNF